MVVRKHPSGEFSSLPRRCQRLARAVPHQPASSIRAKFATVVVSKSIATAYGCKSCPNGQAAVDNQHACALCTPGKIKTVDSVYNDTACTKCDPGTTSSDTGTVCNTCDIGKYSLVAGSPDCKSCDVTKNEYTDGPTNNCRVCDDGFSSTGSECKAETWKMDAGTPDATCNIVFMESQVDGCGLEQTFLQTGNDRTFCAERAHITRHYRMRQNVRGRS